jgi:hypothetical protein
MLLHSMLCRPTCPLASRDGSAEPETSRWGRRQVRGSPDHTTASGELSGMARSPRPKRRGGAFIRGELCRSPQHRHGPRRNPPRGYLYRLPI